MPLTYDEAYTIITDHFGTEWAAGSNDIVGTPLELRFAGIEENAVPVASIARFVMEPVSSPRNAYRNAEYGQRFENNGIIIVQLLVARSSAKAAEHVRLLSSMVMNIFRDPSFPGCFIFRNIRVNNLAPEETFLRANVIIEYQFDELI